ncbi:MAG: DUF1801 domain-containing protein [Planctomycetes bacterium]|nr:DUF1801 domain-containing protein [Planctomycetota bacterium]
MTPKKPAKGAKPSAGRATPAGKRIDQRIRDLADWRGATLARMRALVLSADRSIIEEWKWNNPIWSHGAHGGILCTGEAYAKVVKLTFARAFKALVKSAMALHATGTTPKKSSSPKKNPAQPRLLSGGNPQIAKADGDLAVQAYIAAMPGWKQAVGRRIDAVATRALANVPAAKAVKWNSPFYGVEGQGWLLSFHCFTKYVKVAFFNGASLRPPPPGPSKSDDTRYLDVHEHDSLDETQLAAWIQQAAALPGWGKG